MCSMSNAMSGSSSTTTIRWIALSPLPNNIYGSRLPRTGSGSVTSKPVVGARRGRRPARFSGRSAAQEIVLPPPRPPARESQRDGQRIAKLLARAGIASRREIERMIAEGRIALNGEKITTPATLPDDVTGLPANGRPVRPAKAARLYRYYKPQATLTAAHD